MTEDEHEDQVDPDAPTCEACTAPATRVLVVLIREPEAHVIEGPVCEAHWRDGQAVAESWGDAIASRTP